MISRDEDIRRLENEIKSLRAENQFFRSEFAAQQGLNPRGRNHRPDVQSLRILDELISRAPSAVAVMRGPTFEFERVNTQWQALCSPRSYIGKPYLEVYPELENSFLPKALLEVFQTGETYEAKEMMLRMQTEDGRTEERYYDFYYIRISDPRGQPYGIFCHALEVTERIRSRMLLEETSLQLEMHALRADQERSKFVAAMQAVAEGIFIFDSAGNPVFMNDAAALVFGSASAEELMQRVEYYFERLELRELDDSFIPISGLARGSRIERHPIQGLADQSLSNGHQRSLDLEFQWCSRQTARQ